ncbi:formate/nitrite transporter family protein [Paenibacillus pinistramenti]|uniref:formate/nitrite transporter family protein n=1 Tax=Paenibacillus pinistramenti TaxID=1768003 RepID=UPI001108BB39|nr:formate/nitrite transporter family protein [Paenibacillus pinistramenti]
MAYYKPNEMAELVVDVGVKKARNNLLTLLVLGFLGGAFISIGFLLDIRVIAGAPKEWGTIANFIGAAVFPAGLILVVIAGAELLTGNMMAVPIARYAGKIKTSEVIRNLVLITLSNFVGAIFVAYFFGHVVGLTHSGVYLDKVVDMAGHKLDDSFLQAFISGIGCNWLVALAIWSSYASDNISGKILGLWFPVMAFVAIGFQHVVANMFLIPAAIFEGHYSWGQYLQNFVPVWLGNLVGGGLFVAMAYFLAYLKQAPSAAAVKLPAASKTVRK